MLYPSFSCSVPILQHPTAQGHTRIEAPSQPLASQPAGRAMARRGAGARRQKAAAAVVAPRCSSPPLVAGPASGRQVADQVVLGQPLRGGLGLSGVAARGTPLRRARPLHRHARRDHPRPHDGALHGRRRRPGLLADLPGCGVPGSSAAHNWGQWTWICVDGTCCMHDDVSGPVASEGASGQQGGTPTTRPRSRVPTANPRARGIDVLVCYIFLRAAGRMARARRLC